MMKISDAWKKRKKNGLHYPTEQADLGNCWKILVVDDEPDILKITRLNLKDFMFDDKKLQFIEAASGAETRELLKNENDIAVALIDVVMESDDAGLKLVEYIRQNLKNSFTRLIIRTGQPGMAPERYVIDHYDIDDYKDKTELSAQKLYTTLRSSIKSYRDLCTIEENRISIMRNRDGLEKILAATPQLYHHEVESLSTFFDGLLSHIIGVCDFGESSLLTSIKGALFSYDEQEIVIKSGTGQFDLELESQVLSEEINKIYLEKVIKDNRHVTIIEKGVFVPLASDDKNIGFIYLEATKPLSKQNKEMVMVMANQCAGAIANLKLHLDLKIAYEEAVNMLALAAEFKDANTGIHIRRVALLTKKLALLCGLSKKEAALAAEASKLHDIGKIGVPDAVLQKPEKLTNQEFDIIRSHSGIGEVILSSCEFMSLAKTIAVGHHERWDGTGYPHRLKGNDIPLINRIVAVADVFDALTNVRPYKKAWSLSDAAEEIRNLSGSAFDPMVVDKFMQLYDNGQLEEVK
jgi:response regulator RpfG family c-di-GMP phosphodiesterase